MAVKLTKPPVVRRIEYINSYLRGLKKGYDQEELRKTLAETKKQLETKKALAVGRGNPFRKDLKKTKHLTYECNRITKAMKLITKDPPTITPLGEKYLDLDTEKQKPIICEQHSKAYPHLGVLVTILENHGTLTLPMRNKPPFRPEAKKYGIDTHQVAFDTFKDLATDIGLVNWYTTGEADERRQHVYLTCHRENDDPRYIVFHDREVIPLSVNSASHDKFRATFWDNYIDLVNGIPGAPVYISDLRELVCSELALTDDVFNNQTLTLMEYDDKFSITGSQGILPQSHASAGMLKSLPPLNVDGNYIIYVRIVSR